MKTIVVNEKDIERKWYIVDADGKILGNLASKAASLLMGKNKPAYSPNQDHGDYIIVTNCNKIKLTGSKPVMKKYFRHSKYAGGGKEMTFVEKMEKNPEDIIIHAVRGMLPKNKLGRKMIKKLRVYTDDKIHHEAQKPEKIEI